MIINMNSRSFKILTNQFNFFQSNPLPNVSVLPTENIYKWTIRIKITVDNTPYKGGIFFLF